jgi:hypothetical protein
MPILILIHLSHIVDSLISHIVDSLSSHIVDSLISYIVESLISIERMSSLFEQPSKEENNTIGISSFWLPWIYSCVVISTIILKIQKNSPKFASNFDLLIC